VILFYPDALAAVRTDEVRDFIQGIHNDAGYFPAQDAFDDWRLATPVTGGNRGTGRASLWVLGIVIVAASGGTAIALRRRATRDERE
jgi:hypothetical protein